MRYHLCFFEFMKAEQHFHQKVFDAETCSEAKVKVEGFCEIFFGHILKLRADTDARVGAGWRNDFEYDFAIQIPETATAYRIAYAYLTTLSQWCVIESESRSGHETVASQLLTQDVEISNQLGVDKQATVDRMHREYPKWIVAEYNRRATEKPNEVETSWKTVDLPPV